MDERTRAYLRGRFRDHYRRSEITAPPGAEAREWGYIPWTRSGSTRMVRHRSLLDIGTLSGFLVRERPRHVYFSAGRYEEPGADSMGSKGWQGSDLVFDIDADHLPGISDEDPFDELIAAAKTEVERLVELLTEDFGLADPLVVFSGGRGYHVHVRAGEVQTLDRSEREEIADYVAGVGVTFEDLVETEAVAGTAGRTSPADRRHLPTDGGWSRRVHEYLMETVDELLAADRDLAIERIKRLEGFGDRKAEAALTAVDTNYEAVAAGNIDIHGAFVEFARVIAERALAERGAHVDAPVTTDINRLIRLPGSLHGGTGLVVTPIDPDDLEGFDPGRDAVAPTFEGTEVTVEVPAAVTVELGGQTFTIDPGPQLLPEHVAVFLMARGDAEKGKE